jgi:uncharacterized protein YhbP (UPF0306 family)
MAPRGKSIHARDGFDLLWISEASSHQSVAVKAHARVAATIAMDYSDFPEIQGLQIRGRAFLVTEEASRQHAQVPFRPPSHSRLQP